MVFDSVSSSITGVTIANGDFSGGYGAGINNIGFRLIVVNCVFSNNVAGYGAALHNYQGGFLVVDNCSFLNNTATYGAGLYDDASATASVLNSTFSGNIAIISGGGIYTSGAMNVNNCTIDGNTATYGGGIYYGAGTLAVSDSTITGNAASNGNGGGIDMAFGLSAALWNNIVVGNLYSGSENDISGSVYIATTQYNLLGTSFSGLNSNNQFPTLSQTALMSFGDYGGPNQTVAISPLSAALYAGSSYLLTYTTTSLSASGADTTFTIYGTTFVSAGMVLRIDNEQMLLTNLSTSSGVTTATVVRRVE